MKKKLSIITTHPIQYNAPWFRLLTKRNNIQLKVFYTWSQAERGLKYDPGFGKNIEWDIPLLEGYEYEFVQNTSKQPGTRAYKGIVNPELVNRVKAYSPDCILVNGWNFDSHLKCLRYFHKKIPVLFRGDSTLLDEQKGIRKPARKIILKWVYKKIDFALYVGSQNKQYFLAHGLKESQLLFGPHAVDNNRFAKDSQDIKAVAALREKLNIPGQDLVFLFAGKLEAKKNPVLLIEVFKKNNFLNTHLVIVGNGELEMELKQESRLIKNIHFLNFQNQQMMPVVYGMADVFVLPSKGPGETWGLAVNEAMACGRPVLVSDKCGCAIDLVNDGENGYIFNSADLTDFDEKINKLINSRDNLRAMGDASREKIKGFSFEKIVEQVENIVNKTGK